MSDISPRQETPETEAPETEAPETEETEAPETEETEAPETEETEAPETEETEAPETEETEAPETEETEAPETEETEAPETEETEAPETEAPEVSSEEVEERVGESRYVLYHTISRYTNHGSLLTCIDSLNSDVQATWEFNGDWSEAVTGSLVAGSSVLIVYDGARLPWRDTYHGLPAWSILAYYKFDDGNVQYNLLEGPEMIEGNYCLGAGCSKAGISEDCHVK